MGSASAPSVESILNAVADTVVTIDESGTILSVNPAVRKAFGYSPSELVGRNVNVLMANPHAREHNAYLERYFKTGESRVLGTGQETVGRTKDGTDFPVHLSVTESRGENGRRFFTGVIRDVTQVKRYVDALRRQGEFSRAVLNTVRSLVVVLDRRGRIVDFNRACEDTTGFSFDEVAGRPLWDFFLRAEDRESMIRAFATDDPKRLVNSFASVWLTKKGERRLISWSNSLVFDDDSMEYVIGTGIDITERRNLERMVLEITKKEQHRLGQELHDGLAQRLTSAAIAAKVLEQKLARQESPVARELKRVVDMLNRAVAETRELAQGLYSIHPEDLVSSLKKLAADTERAVGVRCAVRIAPDAHLPEKGLAEHLYRIAREAVGNAVKHGGGKKIRIHLAKRNPRESELRIENDGVPFSWPSDHHGLGLRIMQSQAAALNAAFHIGPGPLGGTVVRCVYPETAA